MNNLNKVHALDRLDELGLRSLKRMRVALLCDPKNPPTARELAETLGYQGKSGLTVLNYLEKRKVIKRVALLKEKDGAAQTRNGWVRTQPVDNMLRELGVLDGQ